MSRVPTDAEGSPDPDLVQLLRNVGVAHAREDYRRATGQHEARPVPPTRVFEVTRKGRRKVEG